ncbi:MAG: hypothetical protein QXQ57_07210 [Sulfolobales archaeon]
MGIVLNNAAFDLRATAVERSLASIVSLILGFIAFLFASITVIKASPLYYAISLLMIALAKNSLGTLASITTITGFAAMLFIDHIKTIYREGQFRSIKYPGRSSIWAVPSLAILLICITLSSLLIAIYISKLVTAIAEPNIFASKNTTLTLLFENPLVRLGVAIVVILVFYRLIIQSFDILALYIYPSRKVSLAVLTSRQDIDMWIDAPLQTIRILVFSSLLAPPIYSVLYDVIIPSLSQYLPTLSGLYSLAARALAALAIFILLSIAMKAVSEDLLIGNVRRVFLISIVLLVLIYGAGVLLSFRASGEIVYSLLNPDLTTLGRSMERIYSTYYLQFIYIFEIILKLIGVAP